MPGQGFKAWAGWGQESVFGTAVAADQFTRMVSDSMATDKDIFLSESREEEHHHEAFYGPDKVGGDIVMEANFEGAELLNHGLFGTYTFTDDTFGNFTHAFKYDPSAAHDFVTGLTVEIDRGLDGALKQHQFAGCQMMRKIIEFDPRGFVRHTYGFRGQEEDLITAASPTFPLRLPVHHGHLSLGLFSFGSATVKVASGRVEVLIPREEDRAVLGSSKVLEPLRIDRPTVTGNMVCELDTGAPGTLEMYEFFMDGVNTTSTLTITAETAGNIVAGTLPYQYTLIGTFQITGGPPSVQDSGIVQIPLDFQFVGDVAGTVYQETYRNGVSAIVT